MAIEATRESPSGPMAWGGTLHWSQSGPKNGMGTVVKDAATQSCLVMVRDRTGLSIPTSTCSAALARQLLLQIGWAGVTSLLWGGAAGQDWGIITIFHSWKKKEHTFPK